MTDNTPPSLHDFEHNEQMEMLSKYEENVGNCGTTLVQKISLTGTTFQTLSANRLKSSLQPEKHTRTGNSMASTTLSWASLGQILI